MNDKTTDPTAGEHHDESDAPLAPVIDAHYPTTPVQCACGWRMTDPGAVSWVEHMVGVAQAVTPEPDNHHNAALCAYCTPHDIPPAVPTTPDAGDASKTWPTDAEGVCDGCQKSPCVCETVVLSSAEGLSEAEQEALWTGVGRWAHYETHDSDEVDRAVERIVAAREAAARAEERERIAQAIEEAGRRKPRDPQWMWAADAAVAARIARESR